jgi:branched-chain amino acid aminotransferase
VVTVPWPRNERGATAGLKTISYAENVRALAYAHEHDASEALFLNTKGDVCEATGSNIFAVVDGALHTPPAESGCLLGVTRALVLELCEDLEIEAIVRAFPPETLERADEAFLTSSTREVEAISHLDAVAYGAAPGPATRRLADAFRALVARDPDP